MTEENNIYSALCKAQAAMHKAAKGGDNPHFESKYATYEDVHGACVPALNDNGIFYTAIQEGKEICTRLHYGAEMLECRVPLMLPERVNMQQLGSAITYARRYGLMMIMGVATGEDDDGNAAAEVSVARDKPQGPPPETLEAVSGALTEDALKIIWEANAAHQDKPEFRDAINRRKKELAAQEEELGVSGKIETTEERLGDELPY